MLRMSPAAVEAEMLGMVGKILRQQVIRDLVTQIYHRTLTITGEDILMDNGEQLKSNFIW